MKKSISINLQGLLFHVEEDGYEHLRRYLSEVKAHFSSYAGAAEIVADIEGRIAELFAARLNPDKQVISAEDVVAVTAQLGRVADFDLPEDEDEPAGTTAGQSTYTKAAPNAAFTTDEPTGPRRLFRDITNKRVAGVAAGLAHYFRTDPLWIRLIFIGLVLISSPVKHMTPWDDDFGLAGLSVMAYLVLWLVMPKQEGLAPATGGPALGSGSRKLYRDTEHGSVGGVSAGLAHYFKIDVTLVRVIFIVLTLAGASGLLIYLILWIVVPEARSLSEKLEMRGEDVTLASIDQSLRSDAPPGAGRARVVQDNLRSVGTTIAPAFRLLFKIVAIFAGFILACVGLAMLVAFGAVVGAMLGLISPDNISTGDIPVSLLRDTVPGWGVLAGLIAFLIPAVSLLLFAIRLFVGRPLLNATARLTLFGLWLVAVGGVAAAAVKVHDDFRESGEALATQTFALTTPIVVLSANESPTDLRVDELTLTGTADSTEPARLTRRVRARGRNEEEARKAAQGIGYAARVRDSVLTMPRDFTFLAHTPWREQRVRLSLALPAGHLYRLTDDFAILLDSKSLDERYYHDGLLDKRLWKMENGRLKLASGPETTLPKEDDRDVTEEDDDADMDINVNGEHVGIHMRGLFGGDFKLREPRANAPHRTFQLDGFQEIDLSGAYQARIRQGAAFHITAHGDQGELDDVRVQVKGNTLVIESDRGFHWGSWRDREPVIFDIELPTLRGIDISGAARADVSGFSEGELGIDQSGASWLRINVQNTELKLDVSGASHTLLTGVSPRLEADLSGACELRARDLDAGNVTLETSGASRAAVRARNELRAEANGASHVTYYGHPRNVTSNSDGAASIKRADGQGNEHSSDEDNDEADADQNDDDSDSF